MNSWLVTTMVARATLIPQVERQAQEYRSKTLPQTALGGAFTLDVAADKAQRDRLWDDLARGTAVTMSGPVFGLLIGWLVFSTVPTAASVLGTALVTTSLILLAISKPR